jgi:outer membrane protein OmpA-like peptidoglycan-associated protein
MKSLKNLIMGGVLALSTPVFSQGYDNPVLIEVDANRKDSAYVQTINPEISFNGDSTFLPGELQNKCENKVLNLYYQHDKSNLNHNDSVDFDSYSKIFKEDPVFFQVRGYADIRGTLDYNNNLALERAKKATNMIKSKYPDAMIELVSVGEIGSEKNLDESRKVEIIPNTPSFYSALNKTKSDYGLIDLSGSMNRFVPRLGASKYDVLRVVKFPEETDLFAFFSGRTPKGKHIPHINEIYPHGSSEVYGSAKDLIDKVIENGKSLTIFTDGVSTDKYISCQDVIDAAKKKEVKVSVVGVGMPQDKVKDYRKIATETGGNYSFGTYLCK